MLKIAIVGCGKQADAHAGIIENIKGSKIVGACDNEELMAKQLYERFKIGNYYGNLDEMLKKEQPDIVHVITPPQAHFEIGKICLDANTNIFFEKPFAMNREEAFDLIEYAKKKRLKITVGHNNQFNGIALKMRELVNNGYIGGRPVHLESIWCYDLSDQRFAKALLGDKNHWTRKLPGNLLHNIISHGICKIAEFLDGDKPDIIAHGYTSPYLKAIDEYSIVDELRVIIHDRKNTSAYFTFSSQIKPMARQFRIYGEKKAIFLDEMNQSIIKYDIKQYKSYLNHFLPQTVYAKKYLSSTFSNIFSFIMQRLSFDSGRKVLIKEFYKSIIKNLPPPIPYKELLLTAYIMDKIFSQLKGRKLA